MNADGAAAPHDDGGRHAAGGGGEGIHNFDDGRDTHKLGKRKHGPVAAGCAVVLDDEMAQGLETVALQPWRQKGKVVDGDTGMEVASLNHLICSLFLSRNTRRISGLRSRRSESLAGG